FSRMVTVGRDLAARLEAHVLDDQGRTFQDSSSPAIDRQISALYDQLDQAGFLAGTERAARVCSCPDVPIRTRPAPAAKPPTPAAKPPTGSAWNPCARKSRATTAAITSKTRRPSRMRSTTA